MFVVDVGITGACLFVVEDEINEGNRRAGESAICGIAIEIADGCEAAFHPEGEEHWLAGEDTDFLFSNGHDVMWSCVCVTGIPTMNTSSETSKEFG